MLENLFTEYKFRLIPRRENQVANSLATTVGNVKVPIYSKRKYKIAIVNRPSILDKSKFWQVFENDLQIKIFLQLLDEFVNTHVDTKNQNSENFQDNVQFADDEVEQKKLKNMIGGK